MALKKFEGKKNYEFLRKCFFSWEGLLNAGKRYPGCQRVFFFFCSEAAIVSGEAAIVLHAREKKKTLWTLNHYKAPQEQWKPVFLARRNNKQALWRSSVRIGYRIYRNIRVKTCTRRGLASLRQAGRCVCGTADWMREIFNLPTRAQSLWIFTRSRFWISQGCNFSCCLSVKCSNWSSYSRT